MIIKKLLVNVLCLILVLGVCACDGNNNVGSSSNTSSTSSQSTSSITPSPSGIEVIADNVFVAKALSADEIKELVKTVIPKYNDILDSMINNAANTFSTNTAILGKNYDELTLRFASGLYHTLLSDSTHDITTIEELVLYADNYMTKNAIKNSIMSTYLNLDSDIYNESDYTSAHPIFIEKDDALYIYRDATVPETISVKTDQYTVTYQDGNKLCIEMPIYYIAEHRDVDVACGKREYVLLSTDKGYKADSCITTVEYQNNNKLSNAQISELVEEMVPKAFDIHHLLGGSIKLDRNDQIKEFGHSYFKLDDPNLRSRADVEAYYKTFLIDEVSEEWTASSFETTSIGFPLVIERNGYLYCVPTGYASASFLKYTDFTVVYQDNNEFIIFLPCYDYHYPWQLSEERPRNYGVCTYVFKLTENGYRITSFL